VVEDDNVLNKLLKHNKIDERYYLYDEIHNKKKTFNIFSI